jgi:hypothetical protein
VGTGREEVVRRGFLDCYHDTERPPRYILLARVNAGV